MKKYNIKLKVVILTILSVCLVTMNSYAHSGRTDSNGGHKDNNNKSGLGSYHYHCGGYPPHLHPNGVCPYTSSSSSSKSSTNNSPSSSKSSTSNSSSNSKSSTNNSSSSNKSGESNSSSSSQSSTSSSSSNSNKSNTSSSALASSSETTTTVQDIIDVTSIQINEKIECIEVGTSKILTTTITPDNATDKNVIWKSNDESIATISSTGEIVAKKSGIVDITANTSNGKSSTIKIDIK